MAGSSPATVEPERAAAPEKAQRAAAELRMRWARCARLAQQDAQLQLQLSGWQSEHSVRLQLLAWPEARVLVTAEAGCGVGLTLQQRWQATVVEPWMAC